MYSTHRMMMYRDRHQVSDYELLLAADILGQCCQITCARANFGTVKSETTKAIVFGLTDGAPCPLFRWRQLRYVQRLADSPEGGICLELDQFATTWMPSGLSQHGTTRPASSVLLVSLVLLSSVNQAVLKC